MHEALYMQAWAMTKKLDIQHSREIVNLFLIQVLYLLATCQTDR